MIRELVSRYAFDADHLLHRLGLHSHNLCLAADITVGWGPETASDWERNETRFLRWFYRWYWQDRCPHCFGEGVLHPIYPEEREVGCNACRGSGKS